MYKGKKVIIIRNNEIILKTEKIFENRNKENNTEETRQMNQFFSFTF